MSGEDVDQYVSIADLSSIEIDLQFIYRAIATWMRATRGLLKMKIMNEWRWYSHLMEWLYKIAVSPNTVKLKTKRRRDMVGSIAPDIILKQYYKWNNKTVLLETTKQIE